MAGQAGRQLLGPPHPWSHRCILTLKVVQPAHPPTPGQEPQHTAGRQTPPSPPPPPSPAHTAGKAREARGGTCEPSPNCAVCTRSSGSGGGPRALLFWTHPLLLTSKWGCPPKAVQGTHLKLVASCSLILWGTGSPELTLFLRYPGTPSLSHPHISLNPRRQCYTSFESNGTG